MSRPPTRRSIAVRHGLLAGALAAGLLVAPATSQAARPAADWQHAKQEIKLAAHETGQAIVAGAHAAGHAIRHAAHAVGAAVHRAVHQR